MNRLARLFARLAPLVGIALPILAAWLLFGARGGRFLGEKIVERVNAAIPGKLAIGTFALGPGLAIRADDVTLLTAEGDKALEARHVAAAVDPSALLHGTRAFYLDVVDAAVDLSPDALGRPALLRALSTGTAQQTNQSGGASFTVDVALANASLVRHVFVATSSGTVETAAKPKGVDLDSANVVLHFAGEGTKWEMSLDGQAALHEPLERPFILHALLGKSGDAFEIRTARIAAGKSRAALEDATWVAAMPESSAGRIALHLAPDDVEYFAKVRPARAIALEGVAGPVGGQFLAFARASVAEGGEIGLALVREPAGLLRAAIDLRSFAPQAWAGDRMPSGALDARASLARLTDGAIAADLESASGRLGGAQIDALTARLLRGADGDIAAALEQVQARDRQGAPWKLARTARFEKHGTQYEIDQLEIDGPREQRIALDGHWPPRPDRPLLAEIRSLELPGLPGELSPVAARLGGILSAHARLEGLRTTAEPAGTASLHWQQARYLERGPGDVLANATFSAGRVALTVDARGEAKEHLKVHADAPLHYPGKSDHALVRASLSRVQLKALHDVTGVLDAGFIGTRAWATLDAKGREGMLAKFATTADVDWARLRRQHPTGALSDLPPLALTIDEVQLAPFASAGLLPREAAGKLTGAVAISHGKAHVNLLLDGARISDVEGITIAIAGEATSGSARVFTRLRAASGGDGAIGAVATIPARGFSDYPHIGWRLLGAVTGIQLGEASGKGQAPVEMRTSPPLEGTLDTALALEGTGLAATGWLYARTADLALSGSRLGTTVLAARLSPRGLAAWLGDRPPGGGRLALFARAEGNPSDWTTQPGGWRATPLFAALWAREIPLSPLGTFFRDQVGGVSGSADARGVLRGTAGAPDPHLHLEIHDGAVTHAETGRISGIEMVANADSRKIKIDRLEAHGGGGKLQANAAAVHIADDWRLNAFVDARRFSLHGERFSGEVDGEAHVAGALAWPQLTAEIRIPHGLVRLPAEPAKNVQPLTEHPDFVVIREGEPEIQRVSGKDSRPRKALAAAIHLLVPDNFWIKGDDVNVEMKGDLWVRLMPDKDAPQLEGQVEAVRGEAAVAGKRFTVQTAQVTFPGGPVPAARLDIHAEHDMDDVDNTKIFASVGGSVGDPKIELTSDPPLPQNAIASLLFLGNTDPRSRPSSSENPSLAGRAATFVGNYLTAELRKNLQTVIPVDVLEFDPGASGSTASGRLRVGKYIAPGLFLVYAHAFGASPEEGSNAVRLEYRFARVWSLLSEYTDRNRGSVDVVWKKEF